MLRLLTARALSMKNTRIAHSARSQLLNEVIRMIERSKNSKRVTPYRHSKGTYTFVHNDATAEQLAYKQSTSGKVRNKLKANDAGNARSDVVTIEMKKRIGRQNHSADNLKNPEL
jgi:esterase/lipase superfamily enzyme